MIERLNRSLRLARESWAVLMQDKALLVFPLCAGIGCVLAATAFLVPLLFFTDLPAMLRQAESHDLNVRTHGGVLYYLLAFLFYLITYAIVVFFNVGLVSCAGIRLRGGNPSVTDGFRLASRNVGRILAWALVAATVGTVLRAIEERAEWLGRLVASILGLVWTLATAFVVPVLVFEEVGPFDAIRRSAAVLSKTWGESVIGNAGLGLIFGLAAIFGVVVFELGFLVTPWAGLGLVVLHWILLAIVQAALQGIFQTAVYEYAANGTVPTAFSADLITQAYVPKKR
jgi:Family of unknown function (DUF6159)